MLYGKTDTYVIRNTILLPGRNVSHPSPREGHVSRRSDDFVDEYHLAAISADCVPVRGCAFQFLRLLMVRFRKIGWKFYLCFIIPGTLGGLALWFFFPDTKGRPLEEIAAIFGDEDEVAVYQQEIEIEGNVITDHHTIAKEAAAVHMEDAAPDRV